MKWISVKDKLPSSWEYVLVCEVAKCGPSVISVACHAKIQWNHLYGEEGCYEDKECVIDMENITHWMPLPWPPVIPYPSDQDRVQ